MTPYVLGYLLILLTALLIVLGLCRAARVQDTMLTERENASADGYGGNLAGPVGRRPASDSRSVSVESFRPSRDPWAETPPSFPGVHPGAGSPLSVRRPGRKAETSPQGVSAPKLAGDHAATAQGQTASPATSNDDGRAAASFPARSGAAKEA